MFARTKSPRWCCVGLSSLIVLIGACTPSVPELLDGLPDVPDGAEPTDTFDGEWLSEEFGFAVRITDRIGVSLPRVRATTHDEGDASITWLPGSLPPGLAPVGRGFGIDTLPQSAIILVCYVISLD